MLAGSGYFYVMIKLIKYQVNPFYCNVPFNFNGADSAEYWNRNKRGDLDKMV